MLLHNVVAFTVCTKLMLALLSHTCSQHVNNVQFCMFVVSMQRIYNDIVWTYVYNLDESLTTGDSTDMFL